MERDNIMSNFVPSAQQQAFYDEVINGTSNIILRARAGCGKTTTITKVAEMLPNKKMLFLSFGKKNQEDLESKLEGLTNAKAQTFGSVGWWAQVVNNSPKFNKKFNKPFDKVKSIVSAMVGCEEDEKLIDPMVEAINLAKNRGIGCAEVCDIHDVDEWQKLIDHFGIADEFALSNEDFIERCIIALKKSNEKMDQIDFNDQVYMPSLYDWDLPKYDFVFVDEAQDSNRSRILMAKKMIKPNVGRIIFVGDDRQAIMGFTGADNDSMDVLEREFNCKVLPLSLTYRCPKTVVSVAQGIVPDIEAHHTNKEGTVSDMDYGDFIHKVSKGDVILCRLNRYLVKIFFKFVKNGIKAKIEGKDQIGSLMWLAAQFGKGKSLIKIVDLLEEYRDQRVQELNEKRKLVAAEALSDKVECLIAVIEFLIAEGRLTLKDLKDQLTSMFGDNVDRSQCVVLCSAHKSKGLEWDNVYILGYNQFMPHKKAEKDWEIDQEYNLMYVAVTRAKNNLIFVNNIPSKIS